MAVQQSLPGPSLSNEGTGLIHFQELVLLCSLVAPNGIRVGRGDFRRGGLSEWSIWEHEAHAALCDLSEFLPLLRSTQQQIGPTAPTPRADRGGRVSLPHTRIF